MLAWRAMFSRTAGRCLLASSRAMAGSSLQPCSVRSLTAAAARRRESQSRGRARARTVAAMMSDEEDDMEPSAIVYAGNNILRQVRVPHPSALCSWTARSRALLRAPPCDAAYHPCLLLVAREVSNT